MIDAKLCAGCVWLDQKNQSCDVTGQCVRRPRNAPPLDPDEYDIFPANECAALQRRIAYLRRMEE